LGLVDIC